MNVHADKKVNNYSAALGGEGEAVKSKSVSGLQDNRASSILQKKQVDTLGNKPDAGIGLQKGPNTTGLPDQLKSGIENLSGHSMDDVKVHYNSSQPAQLNAHAYAQGTDIHIASGQEKHLPHEAWHVVQQKQGRVKPTMQLKGKVNVNDDEGLEKEADVMGAKALSETKVLQSRSVENITIHNPPVQGVFQTLPERNTRTTTFNAPVAQRWLDVKLLKGRSRIHRIRDLAQQANAYNADRKGKTRAMRIDELQRLQVSAMVWLNDLKNPDHNTNDNALWVKQLMNAIQVEHQELVQQSIVQNDTEPPVAKFATLPEATQKQVRTIWNQLVAGTGNVHITETEDFTNVTNGEAESREHEGFRYEVLAQFARLLETETGRTVVAEVNKNTDGKKPVTIKPAFAAETQGAPGGEFAAGPVDSNDSDKMVEVNPSTMFSNQKNAKSKRAAYRQRFVPLDLAAIPEPEKKAAAIYAAQKANPKAAGLLIAGKYFKFGKGSAVDVTITRDIRDAEDHHTSRFVDEDMNEIPAPNFITLGHELGHASHILSGGALGDDGVGDKLLPMMGVSPEKRTTWSNMEEFANISSVENSLRKEYGMRGRFGHINQVSVQRGWLRNVVDAFYNLVDEQPVPQRPAITALLDGATAHLGAMQIPEARTSIRNAAIAFSGQLATSFPAFNAGEFTAIRHQIQVLQTNVASAQITALTAAIGSVTAAQALITTAKDRVLAAAPVPVPVPPPQPGFFRKLWPF